MINFQTMYKKIAFIPLMMAVAVMVMAMPAHAQQVVDPCPVPEDLAKKSPSDMAAVQADIDILTLCVRRASLLQELNNLVTEDMLPPNTLGSAQGQNNLVPNFNDENFEPVDSDLFRLPETQEDTSTSPENNANDFSQDLDVEAEQEKKQKKQEYQIIDINGNQVSGIVARLRSPQGDIVQVKSGDVLSDGAQVSQVSIQGVTLVTNGASKQLNWE